RDDRQGSTASAESSVGLISPSVDRCKRCDPPDVLARGTADRRHVLAGGPGRTDRRLRRRYLRVRFCAVTVLARVPGGRSTWPAPGQRAAPTDPGHRGGLGLGLGPDG